MTEREQFEAWISAPPYEQDTNRFSDDSHTWPGQYEDYAVQLAWEAWQKALERQRVPEGIIDGCTRLSVIDHTPYGQQYGLIYEARNEHNQVSLSMQDGGRTLKVFIDAVPAPEDDR